MVVWTAFAVGIFVGVFLGIFILGLLSADTREDRQLEKQEREAKTK
ncbi:MAG: hypothetical protein ACW98W_14120 [Candidatus Hodarchaeales archaeon]